MIAMTSEQADAVFRAHQDVCVVGGPGSGKTEVVIRRVLLRVEEGVSPLRLVVLAPTEEAAAGLRRALAPVLGELPGEAPICTVEGFCERLLRTWAVQAGLDPEFQILDQAGAHQELHRAVDDALRTLTASDSENMAELWPALDVVDLVEPLAAAYCSMRLTATAAHKGTPEDSGSLERLFAAAEAIAGAAPDEGSSACAEWARCVLALKSVPTSVEHFRVLNGFEAATAGMAPGHALAPALNEIRDGLLTSARSALASEYFAGRRALLWRVLDETDAAYRSRKQSLNALDATDLLECAVRLLRDDTVLRTRVRSEFEEILLDDFQDLTPLQAGVVDLIRRPRRFFATANDDRPAAMANGAFLRFRCALRDSGAAIDYLTRNFRCSESLSSAVSAFTGAVPSTRECNLQANSDDDPEVEIIAACTIGEDEAATENLEAECVAARIREFAGASVSGTVTAAAGPVRFEDIAVFLSDECLAATFERAFERQGIPYRSEGHSFWRRREVMDQIHLLRVISNARDEISMAAVLRSPFASIGNDALFSMGDAGNLACSLGQAAIESLVLEGEDRGRLHRFSALLRELRANAANLSPDRLIERAVIKSGYEETLGTQARENVSRLLSWIRGRRYDAGRLDLLIADLEFQRSANGAISEPADSSGGVLLLPLSEAKGNERAVVFVAGLHRKPVGQAPAIGFSPGAGLVARWVDPDSGEPVHDSAYTAFLDASRQERTAERDRQFCIGLTRAGSRIVLSFVAGAGQATRGERICAAVGIDPGDHSEMCAVVQRDGFRARVWRTSRMPRIEAAPPEVRATLHPVTRPVYTGQHDVIAGVTSIALFKACPRRYYLGRQLGWHAGRNASGSDHYVDDESIDSGDLLREIRKVLSGAEEQSASRQAVEMAARFKAGEIGRRLQNSSRWEREFEFLMPAGSIVVQGRIDLWFEESNELLLAGYKADAIQAEEAWLRADEYALEMRLYALALERHTGRLPNRVLLHFLKPDVIVPISIEPEEVQAALDAVRAFSSAQDTMAFPMRESAQCFRCWYHRGMCPVGI